MKLFKSLSVAIATVALAGGVVSAQAEGYTRQQVRAELEDAVRKGEICAFREPGLTLRELCQNRYPVIATSSGNRPSQEVSSTGAAQPK